MRNHIMRPTNIETWRAFVTFASLIISKILFDFTTSWCDVIFGRLNSTNNHTISTIRFTNKGNLISIAVRNGSKTITKAQTSETCHMSFDLIFPYSLPFPWDSNISWKYAPVVPLKNENQNACVIEPKMKI